MFKRLLCLSVAAAAAGLGAPAPAIRVLIADCAGRGGHLRSVLDAAGAFQTRVTEEPGTLERAVLRRYDVLVIAGCRVKQNAIAQVRVESAGAPSKDPGGRRAATVVLDEGSEYTPAAMAAFAQAVEWAATGRATIGDKLSLDAKDSGAIRALIVTGGHDYEPSFDAMFDGLRWLRANVDPHPKAFQGDLRKRYDVLVLYDMVAALEDRQRRNLVDFAEAGKGIVVLHHALAGHPDWPWWRTLAGAQYVSKSTYLHDRDFTATPAGGGHPVMAGVPALHLHDETYKHMWFAPDNRVLLTTGDRTADGPLAWISGYSKSRVVAIQPGHNRESHIHPGYRRLVHNAIRWAAGR